MEPIDFTGPLKSPKRERYPYEDDLSKKSDAFRLIRLLRGQWNDEIRCELDVYYREEAHYPSYRALSYVWGRWRRDPPKIMVNGDAIKVTNNLDIALRHLREEGDDIILWVDALCINQNNTTERSSQVSQMRNIYSTAREVIIFLGDGSHADYGVSRSRSKSPPGPCRMFGVDDINIPLARQTLDNWKAAALKGPVQALEIFSFLAIITQLQDSSSLLAFFEDFPEAHVTALFEALRRTLLVAWWDRIWVVQEAVVAQDITVRYSDVAASWDFLLQITRTLSRWDFAFTRYPSSISTDCLKVFNLFSRISDLDLHRKGWKAMQRTDLLSLLQYFGHRKASDNRDRVYALIGLCIESATIEPNYYLDETEVYTTAVLAIIKSSRSLSVMFGDHSRKTSQDLPSWIPDWGTITDESDRQRAKIFNLYDAGGDVIPIMDSPKFSKYLRCFKDKDDPKHYLRKYAALELQGAFKMSFGEPEIQGICTSLVNYCSGQSLEDLPRYSLIQNSGRSLIAKCIKIGTVIRVTEPLYTCSDMKSAAKVIHGWAQMQTGDGPNTTDYVSGDFLSTIMSGVKKGPDGFLERLKPNDMPALETWYRENIEQRALGKDQQQSAEPLDTRPDIFTEALRLSATKRTLFFIDYIGKHLNSADELIIDCFIWFKAQKKTLLEFRAQTEALLELEAQKKTLLELQAKIEALLKLEAQKKALFELEVQNKEPFELEAQKKALLELEAQKKVLLELKAQKEAPFKLEAQKKALLKRKAQKEALLERKAQEKVLFELEAQNKAPFELEAQKKVLLELEAQIEALFEFEEQKEALFELEAQKTALLDGAGSVKRGLFNYVKLLADDQLFKIIPSIAAMQGTSDDTYKEFLNKYADLINKRKAVFQTAIDTDFVLNYGNLAAYQEYLYAYEAIIREQKMLKTLILDAYKNSFLEYGYMGLGPLLMKEGDEIYILPGNRSPLVLRPISQASPRTAPQTYQLLGDCYINGAMDGDSVAVGDNIVDYIDSLNPIRRTIAHVLA